MLTPSSRIKFWFRNIPKAANPVDTLRTTTKEKIGDILWNT